MKKFLKIFTILFVTISAVTIVSCGKDDDPADNDLFVGRYNGKVTYLSGSESKSNDNGSVQVVKIGDKYNFIFSDNIPNISGVEISKEDNVGVMVGSSGTHYIRIDASTLKILYLKDGASWTANCTR